MGGGSQSENLSFYSAPFLEPNEISGMDAERMIVVIQGSKRPVSLRKWWAYADARLVGRRPAATSPA